MEAEVDEKMGLSFSRITKTLPTSSYSYARSGAAADGIEQHSQVYDSARSALKDDAMASQPSPFIDLPAEMRNTIYGYALNENTVPVDLDKHRDMLKTKEQGLAVATRDGTQNAPAASSDTTESLGRNNADPPLIYTCIRNAAITDILVASKQLSSEYGSIADKTKELVFTDHFKYHFSKFELPDYVRNITIIEFNLLLFCQRLPCCNHTNIQRCHAVHELKAHFSWIGHVMPQMKHLKRIHFYAHVSHADYKVDGKTTRPCEPFVIRAIQDVCKVNRVKHVVVYRYDAVKEERSLDGPKEKIYEWENGEEKEVEPIKSKKEEEKVHDDEETEDSMSEDVEMSDAPSVVEAMQGNQ